MKGTQESPLFVLMDRNLVTQLVDEAIALNSDLFLVKLDMENLDKIHVEVDGDHGVPLEEIIRIH